MLKIFCVLSLIFIASAMSQTQAATGTFPQVVATFERLGMTEQIPNTVLFRPTKDGLFRITTHLEITQPNPGLSGEWSVVEGWDTGLEGPQGRGASGTNANFDHVQGTFSQSIAHDVARSAIEVLVAHIGGDGSGTKYNVRVVVEQLMYVSVVWYARAYEENTLVLTEQWRMAIRT